MSRYLDLWDAALRPFGRMVWRNPNNLSGVQIERTTPPDPTCFASNPSPQSMAENDCFTCRAAMRCLDTKGTP